MIEISRKAYCDMYGPTVGDRVRLGDTSLIAEVEKDLTVHGDEAKFGGGKSLRDGMGQSCKATDKECLDTVITNALIIDSTGIIKADVGIKDGRIAGIGKAGNPDIMNGVDKNMIIGASTEAIAGEGLILTAGGLDTHIHFISPTQVRTALYSGITTMIGGGTGPADGTNATTCTPGEFRDLILLDCNLPDGNGFSLCSEIRKSSDVFILMLTARDTELDEVKALEMGVDDYMSKPFSIAVLKARIKKLLSRKSEKQWISSNGIRLDKSSCQVICKEEVLELSKIEYKLLLYFLENPGQILSKEQILERIWDKDGKFVDENTVSVNIRRLRRKIEADPQNPQWIQTVHGLGYIWREEEKR